MAPHVVLLPFPAQGHLSPLLHLAHKLAARGISVTFVTIQSIHEQLVKKWAAHPEIQLRALPFKVDLPAGYDAACQEQRVKFHGHIYSLQQPFELLLKGLQPAASCIIADDTMPWIKDTATKLGVQLATYFPGAASWNSVHHHLGLILSQGDLPLQGSGEKLLSYIPGLSPVTARDLPEFFHNVPKQALEEYSKAKASMDQSRWVLVNTFYDLEPQAMDAMRNATSHRYVPVGPLFPVTAPCHGEHINPSLRPEDETCLAWLDDRPASSVLYIAFGSCSRLTKFEFEELVQGLEASQQLFLWVVRPDIVRDRDTYDRFTQRSWKRGLVVSWAPQLKVLAHPAVGGFLTHCGWNSTLESIVNGVPMLCWPRHSDQDLNSKLIEEDFKIGFRLLPRDEAAHWKTIQMRISSFMDVKETDCIRSQVKNLATAARKAAAPGGASYSSISAFADSLTQQQVNQ